MPTKYIVALLAFLTIAKLSKGQGFNMGMAANKIYYQELPYQQINGKLIIEVEIAGNKRKFLFDTGAPNQISAEIAALLKIRKLEKSEITDAYGNVQKLSFAVIKTIKLGDVVFNNTPAIIGIPEFFKCLGVEGIIGSNMLRNSIVQFVGTKKLIIITNDENRLIFNKANFSKLNTKFDTQSSPFITVTINGKRTNEFLFDSGESGFMVISNNYMDDFKKFNAFETLSVGYGANAFSENGAEKNEIKYRIRFPSLTIGNTTFKNIVTETALNNQSNGNRFGSKLLDYGTITVDYLHGKFYLDSYKSDNNLNEKSWPIAPMYNNGKLIIGVVWDKLKGSVTPGLQIMAIDSMNCSQVDICNLITQKPVLAGKSHAMLTLKKANGELQKLEISKE